MRAAKPINVFIFRRDLRLFDNTALIDLIHSARNSQNILPIFIFNPDQIDQTQNPYFGHKCVRFMLECLDELSVDIKKLGGQLVYFNDNQLTVLESISQYYEINSVLFNRDVTPYAIKRDREIFDWCAGRNIHCASSEDYTLHAMDTIKTKSNSFSLVFTPFRRECANFPVRIPWNIPANQRSFVPPNEIKRELNNISDINHFADKHEDAVDLYGGRKAALQILDKIEKGAYKNYEEERNSLYEEKTTQLAAYLKFGCVSARECYYSLLKAYGQSHGLMSQLYWREFYFHMTFQFPTLLASQVTDNPNEPLKSRMKNINWTYNKEHWDLWCIGKTGFPIVDAAMRQMNETGYMNNRARMIVAMFLTKNLHIDWREGEKYFATKLIDYDPCQNNGGWQWSASTGVDGQPYRIFNPWLQAKQHDPKCEYIKRWVPELWMVPISDLLSWDNEKVRNKYLRQGIYTTPIVDHGKTAAYAKDMLKGIR
ncbi:FAD binding domain of DNA photolyase-domain-containing protein [Globomyces pollinis-pini]|nr:FAD binding domain of DNA photolyase-domain-containing protein [Globomyces pollinis-pini]